MSETQEGYETEQEPDAEPTPGPWKQADGSADHLYAGEYAVVKELKSGECAIIAECNRVFGDSNFPECEGHSRVNAALIAAAGTAVQEAREMGYDPQKVVEALPELLKAAEEAREAVDEDGYPDVSRLVDAQRTAKDALASAEGSTDE